MLTLEAAHILLQVGCVVISAQLRPYVGWRASLALCLCFSCMALRRVLLLAYGEAELDLLRRGMLPMAISALLLVGLFELLLAFRKRGPL